MKRDILATITFLTTGLLFYLVQTDGRADARATPEFGCDAAETVWVENTISETESPVLLDEGTLRDS